jgi:glycerophosphoryl diester phosphodiesterase
MKSIVILLAIFSFHQLIAQQSFKIAGHRGFRGMYPENSLLGFQKAIEIGADAIEFDVVVNKDSQLVVSHEPYIDPTYCSSKGENIDANLKSNSIFKMTQQEIEQFDCGSKMHPKFKDQIKISTTKPLLQTVFDSVDFEDKILLFEIKYKYGDTLNYPTLETYAKIVLNEAYTSKYKLQIVFMSFDAAILNQIYLIDNTAKLVYLVYKPNRNVLNLLDNLSFKPYALGLFYPTIRKKKIQILNKKEIQTFAWTVNSEKKAQKLIKAGIDVLITDFPDRMKMLQINK